MNKLEVLYKMAGAMKNKEKVVGNVKIVAKDGDKEFATITNNFEKDKVNGTMSVDAVAKAEIGELKVDKAVKKVLSMEDMHHKHHGHHGHHGKCGKGKGFNKFAKLEMMFKTLNDINVSEDGENKVLELDMKDILMKKREKFKKYHEEGHKCEHKHHDHEGMDENIKEMFKVKHAIFKELMASDYDKVNAKVVLNKDFEIVNLEIEALGQKSLNVKVALNY
ncbi:hypothetical protein [Clostridium sp.]|uniref:hypothetical protein n=1 Tax=Clostridium sp. TaxID=1506 RepID=UPI003995CD00